VAPPGNINWVGFTMQPVIGIEFVADTTRGSGPACEPLCICHPDARPPCLAESLSAPCRSRLPTTSQIQTGTRHASPPVAEGRRPEAAATKSRDRGGAVASPLSHLLVSAAGATAAFKGERARESHGRKPVEEPPLVLLPTAAAVRRVLRPGRAVVGLLRRAVPGRAAARPEAAARQALLADRRRLQLGGTGTLCGGRL
jgi:hypothetical protein